jgi:thiopeptide-type bacteriocin biosynthesis protein
VSLHEAPSAVDLGWNGGLAHEIIIPVANREPAAWPDVSRRPVTTVTTSDQADLPGTGAWLMAKIYGHPDRQNACLARLPDLFADQKTPPALWFLPYRDDDGGDHLRLRLKAPNPVAHQHAIHQFGRWADCLRQRGLLRDLAFDTYRPEIGRFGAGTALAAAHAVFVEDSAVAVLHRRMNPSHDEARALTAASMLDIAIGFSGSIGDGRHWLITHASTRPTDRLDRRLYNRALHLADPRGTQAALRALPDGEQLLDGWARRRTALADYRAALNSPGSPAPDTALAALLHLHSIRVLGLDRPAEQACYRLACAAAHSQIARAEVSP